MGKYDQLKDSFGQVDVLVEFINKSIDESLAILNPEEFLKDIPINKRADWIQEGYKSGSISPQLCEALALYELERSKNSRRSASPLESFFQQLSPDQELRLVKAFQNLLLLDEESIQS